VKDGGAPEADIQPWVTAIARETYGWPQHLIVYASVTAKLLQAQNGKMTTEDLKVILKQGRQAKDVYYNGRINSLDVSGIEALTALLQQTSASDALNMTQKALVIKFE